VVNHPSSVPIRAIRGQSGVGSNCRYLGDPEISVHQRSLVVKIRSISFGCGCAAPGSSVVQIRFSGFWVLGNSANLFQTFLRGFRRWSRIMKHPIRVYPRNQRASLFLWFGTHGTS
jgi:hypothetical protein